MSIYNPNLAGLCENVVTGMKNLQGVNYSFNLGKMNGALDFILSPLNRQSSGVEVLELSDSRGKLKSARVIYKQQGDASLIATGTDAENRGLCDTSIEPEPEEVIVQIDDSVATSVLGFTNDKMKEYCEDKDAFMNEFLLDQLRMAREKLDQSILTKIDAGSGVNYVASGNAVPAGTSKDVDLLDANGNPLYVGFNEIIEDYENNNVTGIPAVVAQGKFDSYFRLQDLVCCNSTTPFTQSVQDAGMAYFKDQHTNAVLGSDELLLVAPGSTQYIGYTENTGIGIDTPTARHITIPDPVYGNSLMWDLDFKWDECEKKWIWFARTYYTVFNTFQPNAFPSGSPLGDRNGMTGIFKYKALKAS